MLRLMLRALSKQGIHVFRRGMPWGAELFRDITLLAGIPEDALVFDVGANEGQTLKRVKEALPGARVHCFEPSQGTFSTLQFMAAKYSNVACHHLALSASKGRAELLAAEVSVMNQIRIVFPTDDEAQVDVSTVDLFMEAHRIERINLLKIDTEGHDLEVLRGAAAALGEGRVDYVLTEVGFGDADRFVSDVEMRTYLGQFGYRLLCIYDQAPTVYGHGWPHVGLYFANMLFVRPNYPERSETGLDNR